MFMVDEWNFLFESLIQCHDGGYPKSQRKTCSSAISSITNLTWTEVGLHPGCKGVRLLTNYLVQSTACARNAFGK
jgi:hypothetical protein